MKTATMDCNTYTLGRLTIEDPHLFDSTEEIVKALIQRVNECCFQAWRAANNPVFCYQDRLDGVRALRGCAEGLLGFLENCLKVKITEDGTSLHMMRYRDFDYLETMLKCAIYHKTDGKEALTL